MTDRFTQNCYAWFNGGVETIQPQNYFPCGTVNSTSDFLTCCMEFDTCVGSNICKSSSGLSTEAEYYLGYCNDPTYTASVCPKQCVDLETNGGGSLGIVYNETSSEWTCCNDTTCKSLSNQVFKAPDPSSLSVIASPTSRPYSTFTTSSASSSSTSSSSATTSSSSGASSMIGSSTVSTTTPTSSPSSSPSSSKLSSGAAAGIGVAAAVSVALLGFLAYFILRLRRANKKSNQETKEQYTKPELSAEIRSRESQGIEVVPIEQHAADARIEMGGGEIPEMGDRRNQAWELPGKGRAVELG
ncbi:hypothetical protein EAF04_007879 [Stromatinia cepivora]|nr:hypothetical protein EAF04_007879 [Stromatinia cepivora]